MIGDDCNDGKHANIHIQNRFTRRVVVEPAAVNMHAETDYDEVVAMIDPNNSRTMA